MRDGATGGGAAAVKAEPATVTVVSSEQAAPAASNVVAKRSTEEGGARQDSVSVLEVCGDALNFAVVLLTTAVLVVVARSEGKGGTWPV